jgi:hypothetical protein
MAADSKALARWTRDNPLHPYVGLLAVVGLAVSAWVGVQSQRARQQLRATTVMWQQAAEQLAMVKQQFRMPTGTESDAILRESGAIGSLGVPQDDRVSLMELVSRLAEASELRDIHVAFQPPISSDSGFVPPRSIGTRSIDQAGYTISLDFTGSFSGLMQFVSTLPPSLLVSRLGAARQGDRGTYHVLLAVYELHNGDGAN